MIRSFKVTNPSGNSLEMELENPYKSGFFVAGITGLGPPKADINTTRRAGSDGSVFNSAKVESRNIVITLVYQTENKDNLDIEQLRHKTYEYFPIKRQVTLYFTTDRRQAHITGYVESNEVALFTNAEGSQISIICNDPWFVSDNTGLTNISLSNIEPIFTFPVKFTPYGGTIEFSEKKKTVTGVIPYYGDLETGITMSIKCVSATGDIAISNDTFEESMLILTQTVKDLTGSVISAGDRIVITTYTGRKTARLYRGSRAYNIIAAINKTSKWIKLYSGVNNLSATPITGNVEVDLDLTVLYEGI